MSISKDPKIQDMRLEQRSLSVSANLSAADVSGGLKAASSEAPSVVAISGAEATRSISISIKEPVKSCQKVQVINKATGEVEPLLSAPVITHLLESGVSKVSTAYVEADGKIVSSSISATCDGTGLSAACIEVSYR